MSSLAALRIGDERRLLEGDSGHLADGEVGAVAVREDGPVHLLQVLVQARSDSADDAGAAALAVDRLDVLRDEVDDVHPEAVDPAVEPPVHHRVDSLAHLGVLPVEVGLLHREQVEEVLLGRGVERPRGAREVRAPAVGLRHVEPGVGGGVECATLLDGGAPSTPPVPVALRILLRRARLDEPRVLVARVVHHEVHHDPDAPLVRLGQQQVELVERAEQRIDVLVVGDVVAVVVLRRGVDRREPDHVDSEIGEVAEPRADAAEVADAVAVRVGERAG